MEEVVSKEGKRLRRKTEKVFLSSQVYVTVSSLLVLLSSLWLCISTSLSCECSISDLRFVL